MPETKPFVRVVFPVPKSPVRSTKIGVFRRLANSLPHWMVSSAECVMISSGKVAQLHENSMVSGREGVGYFACQKPGFGSLGVGFVASPTVKINTKGQCAVPVLYAEQGSHSGKNSRQHVARASLSHTWVSCGVHKSTPIRRGENRVKPLEDHMGLPNLSCL